MKSFKKFRARVQQLIKDRRAKQQNTVTMPVTGSIGGENPVLCPQVIVPVNPAEAPAGTLQITLQNKSNTSYCWAYITGRAIDQNDAPVFVKSDGQGLYYPTSPSATLSPLQADVAIPLGAPGNAVNAYIPKIAGGRIWFSYGSKLTFFLNPGPAVVEPSVTNSADANFDIEWVFCEFTYNSAQLFANISYVDFVNIPIALSLTNTAGTVQTVPGMSADGFSRVCAALRDQAASDGQPWDKLLYPATGTPLRALSPNNLTVSIPNAWGNYWDAYVKAVWVKFTTTNITINTQAAAGNLTGKVNGSTLSLGSAGTFNAPTAADIFSCSTGPFATGSNTARNAVIPRLAAAFNRSILLNASSSTFPNGSNPSSYYQETTTNHYARIIHSVQKDGRGYAFPYDDVVPDGGSDIAGVLFDSNPQVFTVAVGGN